MFLFWDVMSNGVEPIEEAIRASSYGYVSSYSALLLGGFGLGFMGLIGYERWMHGYRRRSLLGPGAASAVEFEAPYPMGLTPARFLAVLIATGIGLHNFAEGLAIGQSAASGELQLAIALIVGFGLHNATEGFGIVAPLTGERRIPSWRFLLLLGLIGGGPTFVGTVVGQAWVSTSLSILFLGLAAGSILYVVMQLLTICRTFGHASLAAWGVTDRARARLRDRLHPRRARRLTARLGCWPTVARFASVFPLVTARALDRPFTYTVEDDVEKGAVVRVRFGGRRVRGVVVEVSDEATGGDRRAARRGGRRPAPAGARRARALARRLLRLDARPRARARRARVAEAAGRAAAAGRARGARRRGRSRQS